MVTMAPSMASMSSSRGIATISFDFSPTARWPSTRRWRAAKVETMCSGARAPFLSAVRREVLSLRVPLRAAVDGNHFGRLAGDGGNPRDEALLEGLGIQGGENGAELVVRGRAVGKRSEAAQQLPFLLAEAGDIDDGLRPGQHREQAQKQDLVQGVDHLAGLPRVRKHLEMLKKDNRFRKRTRRLHGDLPCRIGRPPSIQNFPPLSRSL